MARKHRFKVVEHFNGYAVYDTRSEREHWMSDGVDVLFTRTGKPMSPGSEYFRKEWERMLNEDASATAEACGFDDCPMSKACDVNEPCEDCPNRRE